MTERGSYRELSAACDDAAVVPVHPDRGRAVLPDRPHDVFHLIKPALGREQSQVRIVPEHEGQTEQGQSEDRARKEGFSIAELPALPTLP